MLCKFCQVQITVPVCVACGADNEASFSNALLVVENANPTPENMQGALIVAMRDLEKNAEDTVWITDKETMFERLTELYYLSGGKESVLADIWPHYFGR